MGARGRADAGEPEAAGDVGVIDRTFELLADRELDRCYSLAGYLLGDADEAEDATQEAMARAWRARRRLRDPGQFEAWIDRILVNACMDRMRRRRVVRFVPIDGADPPARDPFRELLDRDELGRALSALPAEQRVAVVLRFWRDLPVDEIAERMGCPPGTVKSRLHSALLVLRDRLGRDGGEVRQ